MKLLFTTFGIICLTFNMNGQLSQQRKDTLLNLAGGELEKYSRMSNTGYLLATGGTIVLTIGAMTPLKKTVNGVTTTKPNGPLIVVGGFMYLCGFACLMSAPSRVANAGYFLKLISGQKVEIPIEPKKRKAKIKAFKNL